MELLVNNNDNLIKLLIEITDSIYVGDIVRMVYKAEKKLHSVDRLNILALIDEIFPYITLKNGYINFNEIRQVKLFFKLVIDVAEHYQNHGETPRRTYTGCSNLGKRYSSFKSNYKESTSRRVLFIRMVSHLSGLGSMPKALTWHESHKELSTTGKYESKWNDTFKKLATIKSLTGSARTADHKISGSSDASVAMRWAYRQRIKYLSNQLTFKQKEALASISFFEDFNLKSPF